MPITYPLEDNPFSTMSYFDRPDRVYVYELIGGEHDEFVNFLHVAEDSRVTWAQDWPQVQQLVAAGVCRDVSRGPATYGHVDTYLV